MKKLLSIGATFGVVASLGMQHPPAMAESVSDVQIQKTSNPVPALLGEMVEFTVTLTGAPHARVSISDDVSDYFDHSHQMPLITDIFDANGQPLDFTLSEEGVISLNGYATLNSEGFFSFTYSILLEEFDDGVITSESCLLPFIPQPTRRPHRPSYVSSNMSEHEVGEEDVNDSVSEEDVSGPVGEEDGKGSVNEEKDLEIAEIEEELSEQNELELEQEALLASEETTASDQDFVEVRQLADCVSLEVPIEPEAPETPEPGDPVKPEPEKPVVQEPEKPTFEHQTKTKELAQTGSDVNTGFIAGLAALLTAVGVALMGLRNKTRKLANKLK